MKLPEFFRALDEHEEDVPIDRLVELLKALELTRADVEDVVNFHPDHYCRNVLQVRPAYAALIICWSAGQRSSIHNHRGSACGVRVLDGTASEMKFERGPDGLLRESHVNVYPTGHVCGSYDADIHMMYNDQPAPQDLVTLHVYTPPMRDVETYSLDSTEVGIWTDTEALAELERYLAKV
jgi:cysteine dioxygenase